MASRWRVTTRTGGKVERSGFDSLDEALAEARRQVEEVMASAPLKTVKAIRDYPPEKQVKSRVEITGKGWLRPPSGGIDVRGDNSLKGFHGGVSRRMLPGAGGELDEILDRLAQLLQG